MCNTIQRLNRKQGATIFSRFGSCLYSRQLVTTSKATWKESDLQGWQTLGSVADMSDPRGGKVDLYEQDGKVRGVHSFYGPLPVSGNIKKSSNDAQVRVLNFKRWKGLLTSDALIFDHGFSAPRLQLADATSHRDQKELDLSMRAKWNAVLILGNLAFSKDIVSTVLSSVRLMKTRDMQCESFCRGSIREDVPLDWATIQLPANRSIVKASDFFIPHYGSFDVSHAYHGLQKASFSSQSMSVPSMKGLRSWAYIDKLMQQSWAKSHMESEVQERLFHLFQEPESSLARYVWKYQARLWTAGKWSRLDELELYFSGLSGVDLQDAMKEEPGRLLNALDKKRQQEMLKAIDDSPDEIFQYLVHLPDVVFQTPSGLQLCALKTSHAIIKAGLALRNCAQNYIPRVRNKECVLFSLRRSDGQDIALGEWSLSKGCFVQLTEKCRRNQLRAEWAALFNHVTTHFSDIFFRSKVGLRLRLKGREKACIFEEVFDSKLAESIQQVVQEVHCFPHKHALWLSERHLRSLMYADISFSIGVATALLPFAIGSGNIQLVRGLVNIGACLENSTAWNDFETRVSGTNIVLAAALQSWDMVAFLVQAGAQLEAPDSEGRTVMQLAAQARRSDILDLMKGKTDVLLPTVLHGSLQMVQSLVSEGENLETFDHMGRTALMLAIHRGHANLVDFLLEKGASVDTCDAHGRTALMRVAAAKHASSASIAESLLLAGSNVNAKDNKNRTALMLAIRAGQSSVVRALLEFGAEVSANMFTRSVLQHAHNKHSAYRAIVRQLLSFEICPGRHVADALRQFARALVHQEDYECLALLSRAGASLKSDETQICNDIVLIAALRTACKNGNPDVAQSLIQLGVEINEVDSKGYTVLMSASWLGDERVVEILLDSGAYVDCVNEYGRTALGLALDNLHWGVAKRLLKAGASRELALKGMSRKRKIAAENMLNSLDR